MDKNNKENKRCRNCIHYGNTCFYSVNKCYNSKSKNFLIVKKPYQRCQDFRWKLDTIYNKNSVCVAAEAKLTDGSYVVRVFNFDTPNVDEIYAAAINQLMMEYNITPNSIRLYTPYKPLKTVLANTPKAYENKLKGK